MGPTPYLTPQQAHDLLDQYGSVRNASRNSEFGRDTIARALKRGAPNDPLPVDGETEDIERTMSRLQDEIKGLRRSLTQARQEELTAQHIRENIFQIAGSSLQPPEWLMEPSKESTPGVPMTLWSDWHWGEVVRLEEMGGVNEFNSEIARKRVHGLADKVVELAVHHMVNPNYPGIVVNLGGDMISGLIHEELRDTNDQFIFPTLLDLQDNIAAALIQMADVFKHVFVVCVVGNHGRNSIKPRMKGRVYTSFEWSVYCQLERFFRNDPRFQFMVPNEADAYYRVYNHRFLLTHGDSMGVKGGDGIIGSIGPIMRGAVKVGRSESEIGRDFDTIVMGHWHSYMDVKGIIVNGALKGYDEYARLGLRVPYERPTQCLWFVHPEHGRTARWPIYLEHVKTDDRPWVSWPTEEVSA